MKKLLFLVSVMFIITLHSQTIVSFQDLADMDIEMGLTTSTSNDDYLFWGEDVKNASYNFNQIDTETYRIDTKWRVSKYNDLGSVSVLIDENDIHLSANSLKCATLKLVTSSVADFSTKTSYELILNNGIYTVNNVNFSDADYFTLEYSVNKTTWDGNNWSTTPSILLKSIFNENYDMNSNASVSACECEIKPDKTLTISNGKYLEVQYDIVNDGSIIVENEGSLVQHDDNSSIGGTGTFQLNKTSLPLDHYYDYVYWSNPLNSTGFTLGEIVPNAWRYYMYDPDQANNGHLYPGWVMLSASDIPVKGMGYAISAPSNHTAGNTLSAAFVKNNEPFNNGDITITIEKRAGTDGDMNLIGNPYPSAIDFNQFATDNTGIEASYSLWTNCAGLNANNHHQESGYTTYTVSGGSGTAVAACENNNGTAKAGQYIATGQGFVVLATASAANPSDFSAHFKNGQRVTDNNNNFLNRPNSHNREIIWLNMTDNNTKFSQIAVGFYPNATDNYDRNYDAQNANIGNGFSLSSALNGYKLAIQGLAKTNLTDKAIPLSIENDATRLITFRIDHFEGFDNTDIFLKDNDLQITQNLKAGDYTVNLAQGTFDNRFELIFNSIQEVENITDANEVLIGQNKGLFNLQTKDVKLKEVYVYDLTGKLLFKKQNINQSALQIDLRQTPNGNMLLFKVFLDNDKPWVTKQIKQ